jgi:plasmid stability protein
MTDVPALHVRDVPPQVYEWLRARASRNRRSINREAIEILARELERERAGAEVMRRLDELRIELPPDSPVPETLIRKDRDSR